MGFPAIINHALAWSGSQLQDESEYIYHLGNADVGEFEARLNVFKTYELDGNQIDCENFPLPTFGAKLRNISHAVYNGRGLCVIRGIDPSDYSVEDLTMLWLGVQSLTGHWPSLSPRYQCRPLIFFEEDHLITNFGPISLLGNNTHPRPESIPTINQRQHEALDIVEAIAQAAELKLQTRPGDMHFINNLALLHRRNSFVDGSLKQEKRHLIRMRLRSSELGWSIPPQLKPDWVAAFESDTWQT
ncbi:taurine catabolism dioxygenase TauD [Seiridium cupressi]